MLLAPPPEYHEVLCWAGIKNHLAGIFGCGPGLNSGLQYVCVPFRRWNSSVRQRRQIPSFQSELFGSSYYCLINFNKFSTWQDISHLLASIFKDLYTTEVIGKDTVANLTKSYRRENDHHAKYVEALQQVTFYPTHYQQE